MSVPLAPLQANFAKILADWSEPLIIKRPATTYDTNNMPSETLTTVAPISPATLLGVWQPEAGDTTYVVAGENITLHATVFLPAGTIVAEYDQIYRADNSWQRAINVSAFPTHIEVGCHKVEGEL